LCCSVFKVQSKRDFQIVTQPRMIVKKSFLQCYGQESFIVSDTYYYNYILTRCQSLFHYLLFVCDIVIL